MAFSSNWMEKWKQIVNADDVMKVIGKHFTADILFEFGDKQYVVCIRNGSIQKIVDKITIEDPWQFALRAPVESWGKFIKPIPPPMYNDIWAMAHPLHGRAKMEGDVKLMWQNLRALTWMLDDMRLVK